MKLYIPQTLYEAISPTILTSTMTGTVPFHINFVEGKYRLLPTKTAKAVSGIYAFFFTCFLVDAILNPNNLVILNYYQSVVSNLGLIFELVGGCSLLYIIYIYNIIFANEVCDVFVCCYKIDQNLMQFRCDLRYKYIFYYQLVHIISGTATYLVTGVMQYINSQSAGFGQLSFSLRIVLLAPLLIIFVMETQFTCLTIILRFRYESINNELKNMQENTVISNIGNIAKTIDVVPVLRGLATKTTEYASPSPVQRLETLMILQDSLCDIVDKVNFNYGLQILISIGLKFVISVFSIYYCYWSKAVKNRTMSSIFWFLWAFYNIYELINLATNCQKAYSQAKITGAFVHKLLLCTKNPGLKEKLTIFSQQLLHRQVRFTALELFSIDGTLLLSIMATGSTYLIIMLQFQDATEGGKHTTVILNSTHAMEAKFITAHTVINAIFYTYTI